MIFTSLDDVIGARWWILDRSIACATRFAVLVERFSRFRRYSAIYFNITFPAHPRSLESKQSTHARAICRYFNKRCQCGERYHNAHLGAPYRYGGGLSFSSWEPVNARRWRMTPPWEIFSAKVSSRAWPKRSASYDFRNFQQKSLSLSSRHDHVVRDI